jgi:putative addiction module killer protein
MLPSGSLTLLAYRDRQGREPFTEWMRGLDKPAAAKVLATLDRMAAGNLSEVKSVGNGVVERRIHWGPGIRIYFGRDGARLVILLAGGSKARQQRDISAAQERWRDYNERRQK